MTLPDHTDSRISYEAILGVDSEHYAYYYYR